jgi:transcription-repair coupling factor (superfamily II helicase)
MYQSNLQLNETASKRLQAIKDFTEFGSGFKVAMRDLEIRGAGNLLGSQQHGHMDSIGYDMYCKLLDRAVKELRGEQTEDVYDLSIDLSVNAYIPSEYISDEQNKLEMYKKIASVTCEKDFFDMQEELEDRFGNIPKFTLNLLDIALMKSYAKKIGIESIKQRKDKISIMLRPSHKINIEKLTKLILSRKYDLKYSSYLVYTPETGTNVTLALTEIFKEIA